MFCVIPQCQRPLVTSASTAQQFPLMTNYLDLRKNKSRQVTLDKKIHFLQRFEVDDRIVIRILPKLNENEIHRGLFIHMMCLLDSSAANNWLPVKGGAL